MKKIVMLPLDERPCNLNYPQMIPKAGYELCIPPKEYMGDKKIPADTERLKNWLLANIEGADACVLSLDTLIYGGIVPSRLHHESEETLIARAKTVELLRAKNPKMKLYLFQLIMRCPDYSLSEEEPDYYADCGKEIHFYGRYTHLEKLGRLTEEDKKAFAEVKAAIPQDVLEDYTGRRAKNLKVLLHNLEYIKNGVCDYFIVPQDDAAVYGFTSMDQITVRSFLKDNTLHTKTAMYPSADDTGLTLLARAANELGGVRPKVFVKYASSKAEGVVPWYEDRALDETVQYHILAIRGQRVYSLPEADIVLAINVGSGMFFESAPGYVTAYDIERNLAAFVGFIEYALEEGKIVAVGDVATCNGSDFEFVRVLSSAGLLLKVHSYAGWNTSSNTLGTTISAAVHYMIGKDEKRRKSFLLHRYYEDTGYMSYARGRVTEEYLPDMGLGYFQTDGTNGKVAELVKKEIVAFIDKNFPELSKEVKDVQISMPWRRMFETDVRLVVKD